MSNEPQQPNWHAFRDLLGNLNEPAHDWNCTCLATQTEMADHFKCAYPDVPFSLEDLRLALHDLNVPYERNEHNNKYYYLANWR